MQALTRRRVDVALLALAAVVVGVISLVASLAGDTERLAVYWTHAEVVDDSTLRVLEVLDYDFGVTARHGILREIPGVSVDTPFEVSSPTAPDEFQIERDVLGVTLRIGDPARTVRNRHRYRISYPIDTVVAGSELAWDAVGAGWDVPVNRAEIHITARRRFGDVRCVRGVTGSWDSCTAREAEPGHLVVEVEGLSAYEGVSVYATLTDATVAMPTVVPPTGPASDPGTGWLLPAAVAALAALIAAGVASRQVRILGREVAWAGGAADAAFGPTGDETYQTRFVDQAELAQMATIEFAAPRDLSAAAGGIIHAEQVLPRHKVAWLIECAIRDEVVLDESGKHLALQRGSAQPHPAVASRLDDIFGGATTVQLGKYDKSFAKAWGRLDQDLERWRSSSGLWNPVGGRRRLLARVLGGFLAALGAAAAALGSAMANRTGPGWLAIVVPGALLAGGALATVIRSWELLVRTPAGSARWLQVESFRRFIHNSEARHAEIAAKMGLLRQYTAWAVSLDELDHWSSAVEDAAREPGSAVAGAWTDVHFMTLAPSLSSATRTASTAPSSSGHGGGGGGGVGGGGGGGGGGSW